MLLCHPTPEIGHQKPPRRGLSGNYLNAVLAIAYCIISLVLNAA